MAKATIESSGDFIEDLNALSQEMTVPMLDILSNEFMAQNTPFKSLEELMVAGGFDVNSNEEFDLIDEAALNSFVSSNTKFSSFQEMSSIAGEEYFEKRFSELTL